MALTLSEAAEEKRISRNAMWLAVKRNEVNCRKTSGGIWLIEEDDKWQNYNPRKYLDRRGRPAGQEGEGEVKDNGAYGPG